MGHRGMVWWEILFDNKAVFEQRPEVREGQLA